MGHEDKSERELLLLLNQKLDIHLENHEKVHATVDARLSSHSNQLKVIWGSGGITGVLAALFGFKGHP